jgi:hypothetical protein
MQADETLPLASKGIGLLPGNLRDRISISVWFTIELNYRVE